jgi:hypothetical protein
MSTKSSSTSFGNCSTKIKFKVSSNSAFRPWKSQTNKIDILSLIEANFCITFVDGKITVSRLPGKSEEN